MPQVMRARQWTRATAAPNLGGGGVHITLGVSGPPSTLSPPSACLRERRQAEELAAQILAAAREAFPESSDGD